MTHRKAAAPVGTAAWVPLLTSALVVVILTLAVGYLRWPPLNELNGYDFSVYMRAAEQMLATGSPYLEAKPPFVYSPAFALAVTPLTALPLDVALAVWRLASGVALVAALHGSRPLAYLIFALPFFEADLLVGNTTTFALAAMIAVIRWPSVRTVVGYAVLVALIPKPQYLPVLIYGLWHVREARLPVLPVGAVGAVMLLWPGYIDALTRLTEVIGAGHYPLPEPWAKVAAVGLTVAGLRWPRLLGPASVCAAFYWWAYSLLPLGLLLVARSAPQEIVEHRADAGPDDPEVGRRERERTGLEEALPALARD